MGGAVVLAITYQAGSEPTGTPPATNPVTGPVASDIDWEFIKRLPNTEVKTGVEPVERPVLADSEPREYVLQAAQFLREEDARVMQAELMLDGFPVSIATRPRDLGGAWHRVLVGPYAAEPDAQQALAQLLDRDIPAQILARPLSRSGPTT